MRLFSLIPLAIHFGLATRCTAQSGEQVILQSSESDSACHNACKALKSTLPQQTYHSLTPDSVSAPDLVSSFFAIQQQEVIPACWLTPTSAQDVSKAINIIREHGCHFAVKSGGHGPSARMSSAEGGVTIDMRLFDSVEIFEGSSGKSEGARIGTGGRWGEVYKKLEPYGKTVVGGRDRRVGVGGFLLGGGISFISRRNGWAIDNILNYEVILSNGTIAQISQSSAPDLYWALRGGGNNFGIVTHFDLATYPLTQAWGGYNFYLLSDISSRLSTLTLPPPAPFTLTTKLLSLLGNFINTVACRLGYCTTISDWLNAYLSFLEKEQYDLDAQLIAALAYVPILDTWTTFANNIHTKPTVDPPVFEAFRKLPHVYSSNRIANFSTFHKELHDWNEGGYRQIWGALSIKPSFSLMQKLVDIFIEESMSIKHIKDVLPSTVFQAITADEILHMSKNGGNCLGLKAEDAPLLVYSFTIHYSLTVEGREDELVGAAGKRIVGRSEKAAKEAGLWHPYVYINYADVEQDVFAGYGEGNRERLREIQRKWDPEGVFGARLQPGGFKV
ncbi:FAD-binding domain-containing protein [Stipitochalara longipes BDJ]|nr:FAD-binding domain-containing protein [Stipitochalara longipes BDJ]